MTEEETSQDTRLIQQTSHESESFEDAPQEASDLKGSALTAFVWTLTVTAGISGLLFGYESDCLCLFKGWQTDSLPAPVLYPPPSSL